MPAVLSTIMILSPILASCVNVVVTIVPPLPLTALICVPEIIPVPVNGAPTGGAVPVKPMYKLPDNVIKLVVRVPFVPLL